MNSKQLFSIVPDAVITGKLKKPLSLLTDDSRLVIPGSCYIAVRGTRFDGHSAIPEALAAGAAAIVAETPAPADIAERGLLWVQTPDTHKADGMLNHRRGAARAGRAAFCPRRISPARGAP